MEIVQFLQQRRFLSRLWLGQVLSCCPFLAPTCGVCTAGMVPAIRVGRWSERVVARVVQLV